PPHAPQGISRRRHIASAGYLACEAHIAPLMAIHPFLAFPSRGRLGTPRRRGSMEKNGVKNAGKG
ncbi:MAG: hypothetical protein IKP55_07035, partial [Clostridia bacterium]|nr:hypothetical protein [Clostridia bacterium]